MTTKCHQSLDQHRGEFKKKKGGGEEGIQFWVKANKCPHILYLHISIDVWKLGSLADSEE